MPFDGLYPEAPSPTLVRGKIANTPANSAASLFVILPSFHPAKRWGPVAWAPHGTTMPQTGADCLVGFDDANVPWLLSFVGPWS